MYFSVTNFQECFCSDSSSASFTSIRILLFNGGLCELRKAVYGHEGLHWHTITTMWLARCFSSTLPFGLDTSLNVAPVANVSNVAKLHSPYEPSSALLGLVCDPCPVAETAASLYRAPRGAPLLSGRGSAPRAPRPHPSLLPEVVSRRFGITLLSATA